MTADHPRVVYNTITHSPHKKDIRLQHIHIFHTTQGRHTTQPQGATKPKSPDRPTQHPNPASIQDSDATRMKHSGFTILTIPLQSATQLKSLRNYSTVGPENIELDKGENPAVTNGIKHI